MPDLADDLLLLADRLQHLLLRDDLRVVLVVTVLAIAEMPSRGAVAND